MEPADPADPRTWTLQRVVGHGAAWSLLLPPAARALAPAARRLAGEDVLLNALAGVAAVGLSIAMTILGRRR